MDLSDLITKLEQAGEGSRELDWAIRDQMMEFGWPGDQTPLYSISVDDALTLAPRWEGYGDVGQHWFLCTPGRDNGTFIGDFRCTIHHPVSSGGGPKFDGYGPTASLAICIAALKARLPHPE